MRRIGIYIAIMLFAAVSFLFSPPPAHDSDKCGPYIKLGRHAGFMVNCDASSFITAAIHPSSLLKPNEYRQGRPLFVLAGTLAGYSSYYISYPFHPGLKKLVDRQVNQSNVLIGNSLPGSNVTVDFIVFYFGYWLINVIVLVLSMFLLERIALMITGGEIRRSMLYLFLFLLVSNHVVKAFFWSPHQQMFTILTPLLCLYTCLKLDSKNIVLPVYFILALLTGFLLLVYGNFLLLVPVILFSFYKQQSRTNLPIAKSIAAIGLICMLSALPTLAWIGLLKANGTVYYNHEMSHTREIVWISDSWAVSPGYFFKAVIRNTSLFFKTLPTLFFFLLLSGGILLFKKDERSAVVENKIGTAQNLLFVSICFLGFLWILGFYAIRLTWSLAPLMLCFAILLAGKRLKSKTLLIFLMAAAVLWHCFNVFSYGPFS